MKNYLKIMCCLSLMAVIATPALAAKKMVYQFVNNFDSKKTQYVIIQLPPPECQQVSPKSSTLKPKQIAKFECKPTWNKKTFIFNVIRTNTCGCQYNCSVRFRTHKKIPILGKGKCKLHIAICPPPGFATCPKKPS